MIMIIISVVLLTVYSSILHYHFTKIESLVLHTVSSGSKDKYTFDYFSTSNFVLGLSFLGVFVFYFRTIVFDIVFIPYKKSNKGIFELCESNDEEAKKLGLHYLQTNYPHLTKKYKILINGNS